MMAQTSERPYSYFYSRPCERGDVLVQKAVPIDYNISTHAPARGATIDAMNCGFRSIISTHAPARGATLSVFQLDAGQIGISTHAPARGATAALLALLIAAMLFLLTPLREGRPGHSCNAAGDHPISTHAPARGATDRGSAQKACHVNFYSRPCERGDSTSG